MQVGKMLMVAGTGWRHMEVYGATLATCMCWEVCMIKRTRSAARQPSILTLPFPLASG